MELDIRVSQFIGEGGGPPAFDPTTEPDNFAELKQLILTLESGGDEELIRAADPVFIDNLARHYLGLPTDTKLKMI